MWWFFHDIYGGGPEVRSKLGLLRKLSAQNRLLEETIASDDNTIVRNAPEAEDDEETMLPDEPVDELEEGMIEDASDSISDVSMHTNSTDLSIEGNNAEEAVVEHKSPTRKKTLQGKGKKRFRYKIAQKYKPVKVLNSGDSC